MRIGDKRILVLKAGMGALFLAGLSLLLVSCGGDDLKPIPTMPEAKMAPPPPAPPENAQAEEEKVYVYSGDRFRDPFNEGGAQTAYQPDGVFNPQQAKLQGIIYSRNFRSALFGIPGTGNYYATGARLFDVMGKTVSGFKVRIAPEKVVLVDEEDETFEFTFKDEEAETKEEKK